MQIKACAAKYLFMQHRDTLVDEQCFRGRYQMLRHWYIVAQMMSYMRMDADESVMINTK